MSHWDQAQHLVLMPLLGARLVGGHGPQPSRYNRLINTCIYYRQNPSWYEVRSLRSKGWS